MSKQPVPKYIITDEMHEKIENYWEKLKFPSKKCAICGEKGQYLYSSYPMALQGVCYDPFKQRSTHYFLHCMCGNCGYVFLMDLDTIMGRDMADDIFKWQK